MLLNNYSVLNSNPGREIGGGSLFSMFTYCKASTWRNFYVGGHVITDQTEKASFQYGYTHPYAWVLAPVAGGVGSFNRMILDIEPNLSVASGLNGGANILFGIDIDNAEAGLIVSAAANLLLSLSTSATISGKLEAAAALGISANVTGALTALASAVADMTFGLTVTGSQTAIGNVSADITSLTTLSPENLAAAVWNSVAAAFNTAGTMGNKLNSAASAGDPWGTALPGSYLSTEAGGILAQIQTLVDELHKIGGLDAANPMTVTPTTRVAGSIDLEITGDGETTTTVTRQ